ncbi:hypothetical protein [Streptomyces sp. NPDC058434]|uniref:hypothetical protein n=1 Tax=Streptomyces sp. NPDC058434 TaxID=3346498 RepID=UPI00364619D1
MTTHQHPQPAATSPSSSEVHVHHFPLRADGNVLALFTGSRADTTVAAQTTEPAARAGPPSPSQPSYAAPASASTP